MSAGAIKVTLRTVSVLLVITLGIYFWRVGLDRADKLASVVASLVAVLALLFSFANFSRTDVRAEQSIRHSKVGASVRQMNAAGQPVRQTVQDSIVEGDIDQDLR